MAVKSYALTTPTRAAEYMGISVPTGTNLSVLERTIDSATDFIEGIIGRRLKKTTYTQEMYDTERAETLNLKNFPVISSETFTLERRSSALNEDDWDTVDTEYYHVDYNSGVIQGAGGLRFARTVKGYRVTYTAGYDFDNTTTFLGDISEVGDLELAAWILVEAIWNNKKGGFSIASERIGDYSVTYRKALLENEDLKSILDKYSAFDLPAVITPYQED